MEQSALPPVSLRELDQLAGRASTVISRLRARLYAPGTEKRLELQFNVRRAAEMVGRSEKAIRDAEADGRLPAPEKDPETGRRTGYSLTDVNRMRQLFGTLPHRAPDDPAMVLAVQNFKGGVGKSSITTNLAAALAEQGYAYRITDADDLLGPAI